jgi:hypothetical protein
MITQDNCLAACGLEPRRFLALIHERQIPYAKLGRLRVVKAADLLAALNVERDQPVTAEPEANEPRSSTQASRLSRAAGLG